MKANTAVSKLDTNEKLLIFEIQVQMGGVAVLNTFHTTKREISPARK
jgi:hypothetical protein